MRTNSLVKLLIAILVLSCAPFSAKGQTTPDVMQGLTPYQSFHGGDFDSINLSNGNVLLRIPVIDYPQRGGILKLGFTFVDNSKEASAGELCFPNAGCEYIWYYYTSHVGSVPTVFNQVVDDQVAFPVQSTFYVGTNEFADYGVVTSDGAIHPLVQNGTATSDATGFYANPSGADDLTQPTLVMNRNGIRFSLTENANGTVTREDPNGNQIFAPAGGGNYTDTVGRSIPPPPGTATTNFSKCPSGGSLLPIASATVWTVPGPSGSNPESFTFCNVTVNLSIPNNEPSPVKGTSSALTLTQSIVLPNGTAWTFEYNDRNPGDPSSVNYGIPTEVILPTGGTITYTFATFQNGYSWSRWVTSRTENANDGTGPHTWNYAFAGIGGTTPTTTVTDPLGNNTVHTFGLFGTSGYFETESQYYQLISGTQKLLKTVTNNYTSLNDGNRQYLIAGVVPKSVTTTWAANNQVTQIQTDYDSQSSGTWSYGDVIAKREYAYGTGAPGALLRTTTTQYEAFINFTYLTNNLLNLPSSVQITDGGGTQRAYTTYNYDEYALQNSGLQAAQQLDTSPADGAYRGNRTSVHRWLNGSATATTNCGISVTNGYLVSFSTYNNSGTAYNSTDSCGSQAGDSKHTTTYVYLSIYDGAYPTTITNPLGQQTNYTYDPGTGLVASVKDANNQTTSFTYDNMWRLATASYPDGGLATITHQEATTPFSATITKKMAASQNYETTNIFDGLGRVSQNQIMDGSQTISTDTTYDANGRKSTVSNPYFSKSDVTYGITTYQYDALNRTKLVIPPDGTATSNNTSTQYCGNITLVTDEAAHWRRSTTDGLGRLIEVDEPNSSTATVNVCPGTGEPIWVTTYAYDTLDDVTGVTQGSSRTRSFFYDSLTHLTASTNPESGTISYTHDADANVATRIDARSITTTYTYDYLNRLTAKTYSDQTEPAYFVYDSSAGWSGVTQTNLIGRMSEAWTGAPSAIAAQIFSYDPVGRVIRNDQCTPINCGTPTYVIAYSYDLAGNMLTESNGYATNTYVYNSAEWATTVTSSYVDANHPATLASGVSYFASGQIGQLTYGNGLTGTYAYNTRFQPCRYDTNSSGTALQSCTASTPSGSLLDFTTGYNLGSSNNGNVATMTATGQQTFNRSYTYDQVNRLATMSAPGNTCSGLSWNYDQWANRTAQNVTGGTCPDAAQYTYTGANQISGGGFTYDAAGNVTHDANHSYFYDAEDRIRQVDGTIAGGCISSHACYSYDALGRRVSKGDVVGEYYYYYDLGGNVVSEWDTVTGYNGWGAFYVYLDGHLLTLYSNDTVYFAHSDHLDSTRLLTNLTKGVYDSMDYLPYGEQIAGASGTTHKYTGKERDAESGNDNFGARYYSSISGRFLSADWSAVPTPIPYANLTNPQTLNLYALVRDNPETFADLDGHILSTLSSNGSDVSFDWSTESYTYTQSVSNVSDFGENSYYASSDNKSSSSGDAQNQTAQQQGDTVTVSFYKGNGVNLFGHSGISVDGDKPVGLEPKNNLLTKIIGTLEGIFTGVPYGHTGGQVDQIASGRMPAKTATMKITSEQAAKIREFIKAQSSQNQGYAVAAHNCAQFSEAALKAGGVGNVPNSVSPRELVDQLIKGGASSGP
jgi:RHS repeat-associated protein